MTDRDEWLWLEDVTGDAALDWVRARNAETIRRHASGPGFDKLRERIREALDSREKIPYVGRRGGHLYNFWQDGEHPRGVWRRTTLEEYRKDDPDWEALLDLDALAEEEGENWVWGGPTVLRPGCRRALIELSRGGADAAVVREFDIEQRRFVPDGFVLPEAKSRVSWIDEDRVYVGTDFGEGSLTGSGYPRLVKEWRRGTPLAEAETVFEASPEDVSVAGYRDHTPGFERDFVRRAIAFYRSELYLRRPDGELRRIEVPEDAVASVHREWLLVQLRTPWTTGGREYPAGALLAVDFEAFLSGDREFTVLFTPDPRTSLQGWTWTRNRLLLTVLCDVRTHLRVLTPRQDGGGGWDCEPLPEPAEMGAVSVLATESYQDDDFLTATEGFLTPDSLLLHSAGRADGEGELLKQEPEFFDSQGLGVEQYFATSADGTRVPYFVVGPRAGSGAGPGPTLLSAYGGFELSMTPSYSPVIGRGWLERGGTYVLANLRGGGEYGPEWHAQAVKEGRHKVYEDFAAVAADLHRRGIASPKTLAIQGGSNGGLLMGVMLTRHPELFAAIAAQVPLLDMQRYHRLLAGASWTAEYGDPDDPEQWAHLRPYSPYHLLREDGSGPYPPVLFTTSTRDDRVHPGHARKMAAAMLDAGHQAHYYENTEGGHGGASNNEQTAFKWALVLDFLWSHTAGAAAGR